MVRRFAVGLFVCWGYGREGHACSPRNFTPTCTGAGMTQHDETALWAFGCKSANVSAPTARIIATTSAGSAEGQAASCSTTIAAASVLSVLDCAAACLQQRGCRAENGTFPCEAIHYTAAGNGSPATCELLGSIDASAPLVATIGTDLYRRIDESDADPGRCGCGDDSSGYGNQCIVGCHDVAGSAAGCIHLTSDGGIFRRKDTGECRGATPSDKADSFFSLYEVATQEECLALCNSLSCFGATVTLFEVTPGVLSSTSFRCVRTTMTFACVNPVSKQIKCAVRMMNRKSGTEASGWRRPCRWSSRTAAFDRRNAGFRCTLCRAASFRHRLCATPARALARTCQHMQGSRAPVPLVRTNELLPLGKAANANKRDGPLR